MKLYTFLILVVLGVTYAGAACYDGNEYLSCDQCDGYCEDSNCYCASDPFTNCIPSSCTLLTNLNNCCPTGLFWHLEENCCSNNIVCHPSCLSEEVCVLENNMATCVCNNSIFRGKTIDDLKPSLVCETGIMNIGFSICLLKYLGYNPESLRLNGSDPVCNSVYADISNNQRTIIIQTLLKTGLCGNLVTKDATKVYYTNTVNIDILNATILTVNPFYLDVTCSYEWTLQNILHIPLRTPACSMPEENTTNITNTINASISSAGGGGNKETVYQCTEGRCSATSLGTVYVMMMVYKDPSYSIPIYDDDTSVIGSDYYLGIVSTYTNEKLRVENCFAFPTFSTYNLHRVYLVSGGCPANNGVFTEILTQNGMTMEVRIRFRSFQFQGFNSLYILCDTQLCLESEECTACKENNPPTAYGNLTNLVTAPCPKEEQCTITAGELACECNSTASTSATLEDVVVSLTCEPGIMYISLRKCRLIQFGYDPSSVQLSGNYSWCNSTYSEVINDTRVQTVKAMPYTGWCGNKIMVNSSQVVYSNMLHVPSIHKETEDEWTFSLSCAYTRYWESQLLLSVQQNKGELIAHELFTCTKVLCANIYTDELLANALFLGQTLDRNSSLYIAIHTNLQDKLRFQITIEDLLISSDSNSTSPSEQWLIQQGRILSPWFRAMQWNPSDVIFTINAQLFTDQSHGNLIFTAKLCDTYTEYCCKLHIYEFL